MKFLHLVSAAKLPSIQNSSSKRVNAYYLLNPRLKRMLQGDFYYAGLYLGKVKNWHFLSKLQPVKHACNAAANKVVVDRKAAWLFICGRDVFRTGILKVMGSKRKGDATLVLNEFGECLGFGRDNR